MAAMAGGLSLHIEAIASEARATKLDPADAMLKGPLRLGKMNLDSGIGVSTCHISLVSCPFLTLYIAIGPVSIRFHFLNLDWLGTICRESG